MPPSKSNETLEPIYHRYAMVTHKAYSNCLDILALVRSGKLDIIGAYEMIKIRADLAKAKATPSNKEK